MIVHLLDGTYELFRHFYGLRRVTKNHDRPFGAVAGVLHTVLGTIESGETYVGVATDHVIESFRNALWPGYKTGAGIERALWSQFHPLEDALRAMGIATWAMTELEADDALASAAHLADADDSVQTVCIWTPDKDLAQCVRGERIVQLNRRTRDVRDEAGVIRKFGVAPSSIPDWLALVGDSADGFPGLPGWGEKSASAVLARYLHLEAIPRLAKDWGVAVRGALALASTLAEQRERALLFRTLATLREDVPLGVDVDGLRWTGPRKDFGGWSERLGAPQLLEHAVALAAARRG